MRIDPRRRRVVVFAVTFGVLVALILGLQLLGMGGRRYLSQQARFDVADVQEGYDRLVSTGVHGRVLVLFDHTTRLDTYDETISMAKIVKGDVASLAVAPNELASALIGRGIVREIYVVFPESEWDRVTRTLQGMDFARQEGDAWVARQRGVRVVMSTHAPKPSGEKAIVYVNAPLESQFDPAALAAWEDPAASDVVIRQASR